MNSDLTQEAILCALNGEWQKAIDLNLKILKAEPQNTDSLNRLARAYAETGNNSKAKKTSRAVLAVDPFNSIALKAMDKWKVLKKGKSYSSHSLNSETFLEEPGKTKVVTLLHLGDPEVLVKLDSADEVNFDCHSHRVSVMTRDGKYIGRLPDDLSARLKKLINNGNIYQAFVKSADKSELKVFIREVERSKKMEDTPSFPTEKIDYVSFTPPELVHNKAEIETGMSDED